MTVLGTPTPAPSEQTGPSRRGPLARLAGPPATGPAERRLAVLCVVAGAWILGGLYLDGWFHIHGPEEESFFTPWHGVLYSGVGAMVAVLGTHLLRHGSLPAGYLPSLAGGVVVGLAGFVDMVWHTVLGVEADLEALLSPPHLLLITAGTLALAGPLRAALRSPARPGLTAALSAGLVVGGLAFFTQYANPLTHLYPVAGYDAASASVLPTGGSEPTGYGLTEVAGVSGVVVWSLLLGAAVALVRRLTPVPAGALALVVAVPSLALLSLRGTWFLLPAVLVAAVVAELVGRRAGPALTAAATTGTLAAGWVLGLLARHDVAWSVELLSGAVVSALGAGYLVGWVLEQGERAARLDEARARA